MNDYEYTFREDVREKKAAGRGAYAKKGGSKSKRCSLPSDNLTPAQKKALNGDVKNYDLRSPMNRAAFKKMPIDLQEEYIRRIAAAFGVSCAAINRELFGNCCNTLHLHAKRKGIKLPTQRGKKDAEVCLVMFRNWIKGEYLPGSMVDRYPEPDVVGEIDAASISVGEIVTEEKKAHFPLKTATLKMEGSVSEIVQALQLFLCGRSAELEISINFKEEI